MQHCRGVLAVLALIAFAAFSAGATAASDSIELHFDNGWLVGSVNGMPPWPFSFTLEGSFAQGSTAILTFDTAGTPTLTVTPTPDPAQAPSPLWYGLQFIAGETVPKMDLSPSTHPFEVPTLTTYDSHGQILASTMANGFTPPGGGSPANSLVPEPATAALTLFGLAAVAAWAARRRPEVLSCR